MIILLICLVFFKEVTDPERFGVAVFDKTRKKLIAIEEKPKKKLIPDNDPTDGKTIERYTFKKKRKPEVTLLKVIGGKHDYPNDINVYLEAWTFFKRQMGK